MFYVYVTDISFMMPKSSRTIFLVLLSAAVMLLAPSCNKIIPAGFWKNYQSNYLIENISDQGPYGGHRAMYWKAEKPNTFNSTNAIHFAVKHGWEFVDSFKINHKEMQTWKENDTPVFPFSYTAFSDTLKTFSTHKYFPRWISTELKVFKFRTDWIAIQAGDDKQTDENGFIVLSTEGAEMSVYHLWGE